MQTAEENNVVFIRNRLMEQNMMNYNMYEGDNLAGQIEKLLDNI